MLNTVRILFAYEPNMDRSEPSFFMTWTNFDVKTKSFYSKLKIHEHIWIM